jgi:hypothetical protein
MGPSKRVRKFSSFLKFYKRTILLLCKSFGLCNTLRDSGTPYINFLDKVQKDRGLATMIKTAKAARLYVTRYLSGQPLITKDLGIRLTKDYLPMRIGPSLLRIARRGTPAEKQLLLTVLTSTRAIVLPTNPDYESITAPNRSEKLDNIVAEMKTHRYGFFRSLGLRNRFHESSFSWTSFHQTTKSGPNGHALWCW